MSGSRAACRLRARRATMCVELVAEGHLLAERRDAALEGERAHRDLPAVARRADDVVGRGARAVEEDLVELGVAGHLADRAASRPRAGRIGTSRKESPPCLRLPSVGAAQRRRTSRDHCASEVQTFWPSMHPLRRLLEARAASARSRDRSRRSAPSSPGTRTPRRAAIARQEALLLRLGAEREQRRAEQLSPSDRARGRRRRARTPRGRSPARRATRRARRTRAASRRRSSARAPSARSQARALLDGACSSPGPPRRAAPQTGRQARPPASPRFRGGSALSSGANPSLTVARGRSEIDARDPRAHAHASPPPC